MSPLRLRLRRGATGSKRLKRVVFALLTVVLSIVLLEISGQLLFRLITGSFYSMKISSGEPTSFRGEVGTMEMPHPYLGYVYNPECNSPALTADHRLPINEFGFIDDTWPLGPARADCYLVGITGGSVAYLLSAHGIDRLLTGLQAIPELRRKKIAVMRLALGGFKEPQQLLTMTYLLAQGIRPDMLINLDGFNEVALPSAELLPKQVCPWFPRTWPRMTPPSTDAGEQQLIDQAHGWRFLAGRLRSWRQEPLAVRSIIVGVALAAGQQFIADQASQAERQLLSYNRPAEYHRAIDGPRFTGSSDTDLYRQLAQVWAESSRQLDRLCRSNGVIYVHCLQPNQYDPGAKPMRDAERRIAWRDDHPYRPGVQNGYPWLRRYGAELRNDQVCFFDLSMMFRNHLEPLYSDDACHLNQAGNDLLAQAVVAAVAETLRSGAGNHR